MLQNSSLLGRSGRLGWAEEPTQMWELVECCANRAIVPNDELLACVRAPAHLGGARGEDPRQPPIQEAIGGGGDLEMCTDAGEKRRQQLRAPFALRREPCRARGGSCRKRLRHAV